MNIIVDNALNGNPRLSNKELTVLDVVSGCYYDSTDTFLSANPELTEGELVQVLEYCKNRRCDSSGGHCGGCSLRLPDDGVNNMNDFINRFSEIRFIESDEVIEGTGEGIMVMPGNRNELGSNWKGVNGWEMSGKILHDISL